MQLLFMQVLSYDTRLSCIIQWGRIGHSAWHDMQDSFGCTAPNQHTLSISKHLRLCSFFSSTETSKLRPTGVFEQVAAHAGENELGQDQVTAPIRQANSDKRNKATCFMHASFENLPRLRAHYATT